MMTATYSPEDNKLRLYSDARLGKDTYERVKAAGFKWAPKQELFVAPAWTPDREDLLLDLCGEIGDEDTSLVERAEERSSRFEDYSDKRETDAERAKAAVEAIAGQIPLGQPILVGHHSEKHARKHAEQIQNGMRKAVQLWRTSQYWADRAAGAIRNAKYKERADVRARRIKGLEADERKRAKEKAEAETTLATWSKDYTREQFYHIAGRSNGCYVADTWTAYDILRPTEEGRYDSAPEMTLEEVKDKVRANCRARIERAGRWLEHLGNRLAYERAMMQESGGIPADKVGPEKGGACRCWASPGYGKGWSYIVKVNKVSVTVLDNWGNGGANFTRTIPFDKLSALMTKADVDVARASGRLHETDGGRGFFVDAPAETRRESAERVHAEAVASKEKADAFDALADTLKAGVTVVAADQLFPTPPDVAARVVELAEIGPGMDVLEPSAGTGALLRAAWDLGANLYAVEINPTLVAGLKEMADRRELADCRCGDFLAMNGELGTFDRIVMNPPFADAADIRHILHARAKLKPGGRLVAICANGPRQRAALGPIADAWIDLPAGSFKESGTGVNAAIVVMGPCQ